MLRISRDLVSGLVFAAIGAAAIAVATGYPMGAATKMGPGYFPTAIGIVLLALGTIKIVRSLVWRLGEPIERLALRPFVLIPGAVVLFGLLLRVGLVPAILALIFIACLARPGARRLESLFIFLIATVIAALLWVYGLGFPVQSLL